jgi:hypothetical protein
MRVLGSVLLLILVLTCAVVAFVGESTMDVLDPVAIEAPLSLDAIGPATLALMPEDVPSRDLAMCAHQEQRECRHTAATLTDNLVLPTNYFTASANGLWDRPGTAVVNVGVWPAPCPSYDSCRM